MNSKLRLGENLSKLISSFQPNIIPICLPQSDSDLVGKTGSVTGWGRRSEYGQISDWSSNQQEEHESDFNDDDENPDSYPDSHYLHFAPMTELQNAERIPPNLVQIEQEQPGPQTTATECDQCGEKFKHLPGLTQHKEVIHSPTEGLMTDMTIHIKIDDGRDPQYDTCSTTFLQDAALGIQEHTHSPGSTQTNNKVTTESEKEPDEDWRDNPYLPMERTSNIWDNEPGEAFLLAIKTLSVSLTPDSNTLEDGQHNQCGNKMIQSNIEFLQAPLFEGDICDTFLRSLSDLLSEDQLRKEQDDEDCLVSDQASSQEVKLAPESLKDFCVPTLERRTSNHSQLKPYVCEICTKRFSKVSTLIRHKWIHEEKTNFRCRICGKSFYN